MTELIRNAWLGWTSYKSAGKFAALPMAFLLFLAVYQALKPIDAGILFEKGTQQGKRRKVLFIYTAVIMALCICPVTAAVLMLYQTKFYNYEWIWSYVPVTAVTAAGGCFILTLIWKKRYTAADRLKAGAATLLLAAAVVMCGQPVGSETSDDSLETLVQYDKTALVISELKEVTAQKNMTDGDNAAEICIWAPQEILEHARQCSADITLIYGRNMWDNALNAYAYDTYPEEYENMYQWMQLVEEYGEIDYEDKTEDFLIYKDTVTDAIMAGVNVIILPQNTSEKTIAEVRACAGVQEIKIQGYAVFVII